jgi:hypothetical protein
LLLLGGLMSAAAVQGVGGEEHGGDMHMDVFLQNE